MQHLIDIGGEPKKYSGRRAQTVGALIDLHLEDFREVGRPIRRSKMAVMKAAKLTGSQGAGWGTVNDQ